MKKSLYLTSALVAASVLALGSSATMAASKAKPMKLGISGSYEAIVGYSKQGDSFVNTGTSTVRTGYSSVDVKTDSEIHFKGSTKTDNGLAIGVHIELESDQATTAIMDQSFVTVGGGFGTIALGNTVAASKVLTVSAPNTGALGIGGGDSSAWIVNPTSVPNAAGPDIGGGDHMKVRWTSPAFSGFSVGGSYVPSMTSSNNMALNGGNAGTETDQIDFGVKYTGKMGANAITAGYNTWTSDGALAASLKGHNLGVSTTMGAITVGAAYNKVEPTGTLNDAARTTVKGSGDTSPQSEAWNIGTSWAQGATTLSLNYFQFKMPMSSTVVGEDSVTKWTLGAKYAMGPGVDFVGTVQRVNWSDETVVETASNTGMAVVGGIAVKF